MSEISKIVSLMFVEGLTAEEVIEIYRQHRTQHGNDLDLLNQSMMLIQTGHYREATKLALRVEAPSSTVEEVFDEVDKPTAQAAFLAASDRARPLFEQAALEIEGIVENSHTMATYRMVKEVLLSDPNW